MNLTLHPDILRLIEDRVRSGQYDSAEEVVAAALTNLDQQDRIANLPLDEVQAMYPGIRESIEHGYAQAKAGPLSDGEEFFGELDREDEQAG